MNNNNQLYADRAPRRIVVETISAIADLQTLYRTKRVHIMIVYLLFTYRRDIEHQLQHTHNACCTHTRTDLLTLEDCGVYTALYYSAASSDATIVWRMMQIDIYAVSPITFLSTAVQQHCCEEQNDRISRKLLKGTGGRLFNARVRICWVGKVHVLFGVSADVRYGLPIVSISIYRRTRLVYYNAHTDVRGIFRATNSPEISITEAELHFSIL